MTATNRRAEQLTEAALNLGMSESDARHYAAEALRRELEAEARVNNLHAYEE